MYQDIPHKYYGVSSKKEYKSVSVVFSGMKAKQNWEGILHGSARKQGVDPEWLRGEWDRKKFCGTTAGTTVHLKREKEILEAFVVDWGGEDYTPQPYLIDTVLEDTKYQLKELKGGSVYPELIVSYPDLSIPVAGTSDEVYIDYNGFVHIVDTKTDQGINYEGYKGQTLVNGLEHRQDCNYDGYSIKCSTYMYLLLKTYPNLKPGTITLRHTPIARDEDGCAIINPDNTVDVLGEEYIGVDYTKNVKDVEIMLNYFKSTL